jgi:general secretion pathway protein I
MASSWILHNQRLHSSRGFSLIEVLIALSIMMGVFTVVGTAWSTSQLRMRKMKLNHQVSYLLDYKVADVEREFKDQMALIPEADAGDFEILGKEFVDFTWKLKSKKFELPDMTGLMINEKGSIDPMLMTMIKQLTDYFAQAAKEVTITVVYTYKKKKVEYSATTFIVDYNQPLPLPGAGSPTPAPGP